MSEQDASVSRDTLEVRADGKRAADVSIPVEIPLVIDLNGRPVATLMALPGMERELAIGFCLSEGLVRSVADLLLVQYCRAEAALIPEEEGGAVVRVQARPEAVRAQGTGMRLVLSGCGGVATDLEALDLPPLPAGEGPVIQPEALWAMAALVRRGQETYRQAGGVHAAALFTPAGDLLVAAEDIGRHNAVDKVLGATLARGLALDDKVLLSTGRASHELVTKALRLGVRVAGSLSVATSLAIELAEQGNCTLLGRLRRERFLVYTHPWRIA